MVCLSLLQIRLCRAGLMLPLVVTLGACSLPPLRAPAEVKPSNVNADATLTPATRITRDLVKLPAPAFRVPVAVYAFRDQTGQFKPQPDSNLSNAVTQGAASILVKTLLDSGWFLPIEREGFQNLLNERRVARAIEVPADKGKIGSSYPQLVPAQFIFEGGIVGFESNVRTGGQGANLLGIGGETKYRVDQVTVNLRSVDVRTGQVVNSVSVTKTIFSHEISSSIYKFVSYKTLLQAEGGYSTNEPTQLAVKEAIESAVIHLTLQGVRDRVWALRDPQDWLNPMVQSYMREAESLWVDPETAAVAEPIPMRGPSLVKAPQLPLHLAQQPTPPAQQPPALLVQQPALLPAQSPATLPPPAAQTGAPLAVPSEASMPTTPSLVVRPVLPVPNTATDPSAVVKQPPPVGAPTGVSRSVPAAPTDAGVVAPAAVPQPTAATLPSPVGTIPVSVAAPVVSPSPARPAPTEQSDAVSSDLMPSAQPVATGSAPTKIAPRGWGQPKPLVPAPTKPGAGESPAAEVAPPTGTPSAATKSPVAARRAAPAGLISRVNPKSVDMTTLLSQATQ
jgi:curli production assembly/transport component CsgG